MPAIPKKQTGPKQPKITRRIIEKEIRVGLEGEAREEYTKSLLKRLRAIEDLETEKKNTVADYNATIKKLQGEADSDRLTLEYGAPEIHEVEEIKDFKKKTVTYKRVDTGKVVEEREMTQDDLQLHFGEKQDDPEEGTDDE